MSMYSACALLATRRCFALLLLLALLLYGPKATAQGIECSSTATRVNIRFADCVTVQGFLSAQMKLFGGENYNIGAHLEPLIVRYGTCQMTLYPVANIPSTATLAVDPFINELRKLLHVCVNGKGVGGTHTSIYSVLQVTSSDTHARQVFDHNSRSTYSFGPNGVRWHPPSSQVHSTVQPAGEPRLEELKGIFPQALDIGRAVRHVLQESPDIPVFQQHQPEASPPRPRSTQLPVYPSSPASAHGFAAIRGGTDIQPVASLPQGQGSVVPVTEHNVPAALEHQTPGSATDVRLFGVQLSPGSATSGPAVSAKVSDSIQGPATADDRAAASGSIVPANPSFPLRQSKRRRKGFKSLSADFYALPQQSPEPMSTALPASPPSSKPKHRRKKSIPQPAPF